MKMFTFGIEREKKAYINVYLYHLVNQERSNLFVIWSLLTRWIKTIVEERISVIIHQTTNFFFDSRKNFFKNV